MSRISFVRSVWQDMLVRGGIEKAILNELQIHTARKNFVRAEMNIKSHHTNRLGIIHGGVLSTLVDVGGSLALSSQGMFMTGVTTDLSTTFLSSGGKPGNKLVIDCYLQRFGRTMAFTFVEICRSDQVREVNQERAILMVDQDVIVQATPPGMEDKGDLSAAADLPETVSLKMHGRRFEVKRERLLSLPECILFGLSTGMTATPFGSHEDVDPDVMELDFNPNCFEYILNTLNETDNGIIPKPVTDFKASKPAGWQESNTNSNTHTNDEENFEDEDNDSVDSLPWLPLSSLEIPQVLESRPSLIVLREDLEYFVLNGSISSNDEISRLKGRIGDIITNGESNRQIFKGLRNKDTIDSPEYHLMQMLVLAGLSPNIEWDFRDRRERSSQVLSLQMSKVKIPQNSEMLEQIYALQKLLLFWRKPAKKCWWDKTEIDGSIVHVRRVWTLELSIVGLAL